MRMSLVEPSVPATESDAPGDRFSAAPLASSKSPLMWFSTMVPMPELLSMSSDRKVSLRDFCSPGFNCT
ncbi:hypothetical protein D9M72_239710 [compost metagenome]